MKNKIAIILSGCGVFDGSEIHEATLTMLAVKKHNFEYAIFAPDVMQADTINHITGQPESDKRNVLVESARIARGKALPLSQLNVNDFDSVILPGGFGAAKNLCNFAFKGDKFEVIPQLEEVLLKFNAHNKPIGALCIAPVILAKVFPNSTVTVGAECDASEVIEKIGSHHKVTTHGETVTDPEYRLVTTPCYMLDADIYQVAVGAENLVKELIKLMQK